MRNRLPSRSIARRGVTLRETAVVVGAVGFILAGYAMYPRVRGCREISTRAVCAANVKGIGTSMMIYAAENGGAWPTPAFDESRIGRIGYTAPVGGGAGTARSPDRRQESRSGLDGAAELSVTRAFWMLIRSGETTPKSFICPNSGDQTDDTKRIEDFYDFADTSHVSYGLQVPFGPRMTRAGSWMDPRLVVAAERGPYVGLSSPVPSEYPEDLGWLTKNMPGISQNHRGEGQSVLFGDGHWEYRHSPLAGIDGDNIYTVTTDEATAKIGESPWERNGHPRVRIDEAGNPLPTFDSVIFP